MRSWVQALVTASCRNVGKDCVHKTQSGRTLPRTLRKQELRASGCPFNYAHLMLTTSISYQRLKQVTFSTATFCQIWNSTRYTRSVSPLSIAFDNALSCSSMLSNKGICENMKQISDGFQYNFYTGDAITLSLFTCTC
jgi:hypothetical protein